MNSPPSFCDNHFSPKLIKFIPERLHFQLYINIGYFRVLFHQRFVRRWAWRGAVGPSGVRLRRGLRWVGSGIAVAVLGSRARLKLAFMVAVWIPRGRREMVTPRRIETAQAAGREGCNIAKMGQLRQPRAWYCWNHSKNWIYNLRRTRVQKQQYASECNMFAYEFQRESNFTMSQVIVCRVSYEWIQELKERWSPSRLTHSP